MIDATTAALIGAAVGALASLIGVFIAGGVTIGVKIAELRSQRKIKVIELEFQKKHEDLIVTRQKLEELFQMMNDYYYKAQELKSWQLKAYKNVGDPMSNLEGLLERNRSMASLEGQIQISQILYLEEGRDGFLEFLDAAHSFQETILNRPQDVMDVEADLRYMNEGIAKMAEVIKTKVNAIRSTPVQELS